MPVPPIFLLPAIPAIPAIPALTLGPTLGPYAPYAAILARFSASSLLAAALARDLWNRTPQWVREDELWRSLIYSEEVLRQRQHRQRQREQNSQSSKGNGHNRHNNATNSTDEYSEYNEQQQHQDEMASLTAVIQKLQALLVMGYDKLGSEQRVSRRRRRVRVAMARASSTVNATKSLEQKERVLLNVQSNDEDEKDKDKKTMEKIRQTKHIGQTDETGQSSDQLNMLNVLPLNCANCRCQDVTNCSFCSFCSPVDNVELDSEFLIECDPTEVNEAENLKNRGQENPAITSPENPEVPSTTKLNSNNVDDTAPITTLEWHAALLAYIQLCNQIRERYPMWRDEIYQQYELPESQPSEPTQEPLDANPSVEENLSIGANPSGEPPCAPSTTSAKHATNVTDTSIVNTETIETNPGSPIKDCQSAVTKSQIKQLQIMLDYAVWAYEADEEKLRSLLLNDEHNCGAHGSGGTCCGASETHGATARSASCTSDVANGDADNSKAVEQNLSQVNSCDSWEVIDKNHRQHDGGFQLLLHRTTDYIEPMKESTPNSNNDNAENDNQSKRSSKQNKQKKQHRKPPGRVGYYVAISHPRKTLLIGIKGTSTLEELLTDCCGRAIRVDLEGDPHGSHGGCDVNGGFDANGVESGYELGSVETSTECDQCNRSDANSLNLDKREVDKNGQSDIVQINENIFEEKKSNTHLQSSNEIFKSKGGDGEPSSEANLPNGLVEVVRISKDSDNHPTGEMEVQILSKFQIDGLGMRQKFHHSTDSTIENDSSLSEFPEIPSSSSNASSPPCLLPAQSSPQIAPTISPTEPQQQQKQHHQKEEESLPNKSAKERISSEEEVLESNGIEMEHNRNTKIRGAHEGILHCARQLFNEIAPLIEEYAVNAVNEDGYDVVCTGHSLGAGTAALLAVLIRGRYPQLTLTRCRHRQEHEHHQHGSRHYLQRVEKVRAYAFAPPPILDRTSSLSTCHYVTSVVHNSDIIPRCSLTNLDVVLTILEGVRSCLMERGLNPVRRTTNVGEDPENACRCRSADCFMCNVSGSNGVLDPNGADGAAATNSNSSKGNKGSNVSKRANQQKGVLASVIDLFRKLSEGTGGELLMAPQQLQQLFNEAIAEASLGDGSQDELYWDEVGDHHLFVPGRVLMMYEPWSEENVGNAALESDNISRAAKERSPDEQIHENEQQIKRHDYHTMWINGTASMLKMFEVGAGSGMATDHLTTSYYRALVSLLENSDG